MSSELSRRLCDWLDRRAGLRQLIQSQLTGYRLPEGSRSWLNLGGLLAFLFVLQLGSGALLLLYYSPDPERAFDSLQRIRREVPFGWLVQLVHAHGGNLMVAAVFLHMLRGAYLGAYKDPRELNWLSGCALLVLTMGASLTGYILPWSQVSYWATTVVTSSLESVPAVGAALLQLIRGGDAVGPATLSRAFAAHVALIPLAMIGWIALHLYLLRHHGAAPPPRRKGAAARAEPSLPFYPDFVLQDALSIVACLLLLLSLALFAPNLFSSPLSFVAADPLETPLDVKPEWYFLWSYQLLRMVPERLAVALQAAAFVLLVALPFLDRSPHRHPVDRPWVMAGLAAGVAGLIALTVLGYLA